MAYSRGRVTARAIRTISIASLVAALSVGAAAPVEAGKSDPSRVARTAKAQRGDPWVYAAVGPHAFDCSGLVYFAFRQVGLLELIGGRRMGVRDYWRWFAERGRASRSNGRRGDLVVWGNGTHIGIYLGDGRAVSTLVSGVRIHRLHGLTDPFTTFLHVRYAAD